MIENMSDYILLKMGHPLVIINSADRTDYLAALNAIRKEGTDEYLIRFFFRIATARMKQDVTDHQSATQRQRHLNFLF